MGCSPRVRAVSERLRSMPWWLLVRGCRDVVVRSIVVHRRFHVFLLSCWISATLPNTLPPASEQPLHLGHGGLEKWWLPPMVPFGEELWVVFSKKEKEIRNKEDEFVTYELTVLRRVWMPQMGKTNSLKKFV